MRTFEVLFQSPELARFFWPAVIVGLLVSVLCAALSPLVVLRRMSFIGQGVSHAAFLGVGLAMIIGLNESDLGVFAIVGVTCVGAALGIAALSERRGLNADTAIGIVLVSAMALGFVLIQQALSAMRARGESPMFGVESVMFGSVLGVGWPDVAAAAVVVVGQLTVLWWCRRNLIYWAFDPVGAATSGVRVGVMRSLLLVLLAMAIVVTMRLAGVVLATALLVLPGATALRLSARFWPVVAISAAAGFFAVAGGLVVSLELDWQPGPAIVLVQVAFYALAWIGSALWGREASARAMAT